MDTPKSIQYNWQHRQDTRRRQTKQKHKTICFVHHYAHYNTNNVNQTYSFLQTTKDEPNIVLCGNRNGNHNTESKT